MIQSFVFSEGKLVGRDLELEALRLVRADKGLVLWVDLFNPTPEEVTSVLEGVFQFHPLAIEDSVNPNSLPKLEDYEEYMFIVTHGVDFTRRDKFNTAELDLFLGKDYLVTFHQTSLKSVQSAMERCIKATGVVARGPDRLAHIVLDFLVDNYKPVVDELRAVLDGIEESVLAEDAGKNLIPRLLEVKVEVSRLRQVIRPQRELVNRLAHGENKYIRPAMLPYYRDLRDNLAQVDDAASAFADQLLISFDLYLSKSDFQANEGIKALTALTALTLPATLIATWYGMNFQHMPELSSPYGYPLAIAATIGLTYLMWRWCKRRKWI
jgi:magnesium transporter